MGYVETDGGLSNMNVLDFSAVERVHFEGAMGGKYINFGDGWFLQIICPRFKFFPAALPWSSDICAI